MAFHNIIIDKSQFSQINNSEINVITLKGDYDVSVGDNLIIHSYVKPKIFSIEVTESITTVLVEQITVVKNRYGKVKYKKVFFSLIKKAQKGSDNSE